MTDELTQEIIDWYTVRGKNLSALTDPSRMPPRVTREQVEVAAIKFYNEIQHDDFNARMLILKSGKELKYIRIAWEIWDMAKSVNAEEYAEGHKKMLGAAKIIQDMDEKHRAYAELSIKSEDRTRREQRALAAGLWLWLIWETYRAFGG